MSHLVAPSSFRLGKTQPWYNNVLLGTKDVSMSGDTTTTAGLTKVAAALLRRKRLYVVKSTAVDKHGSRAHHRLLFVPRIKIRPREHSIGGFLRKSLLKSVALDTAAPRFKRYADLRKDKAARIRRRPRPKRLNRWLSRRMFRGAGRALAISRPPAPSTSYENSAAFSFADAPLQGMTTLVDAAKTEMWRQVCPKYYDRIHRRQKWKFDGIAIRRFNSARFSDVVSRVLNRPVRLDCLNLFAYLVQKQQLNFKSHQNHFWNFRYRRYRFQYKNYYDILNSFLFMGLADNTETFFLSVLKITLPLILKIRKFFKFLSAVMRYLPEIENKFSVFKLSIAGKLAGGTKRTKFHSIGYGVLPVQSLTTNAVNSFLAYTHIYGEFGLKLIMCKRSILGAYDGLRY